MAENGGALVRCDLDIAVDPILGVTVLHTRVIAYLASTAAGENLGATTERHSAKTRYGVQGARRSHLRSTCCAQPSCLQCIADNGAALVG